MNITETAHKVLPYVLKPLSWFYGAVTEVRNWLFDRNILPVEEFDVPVVSVGNLTVGGTGKTPHVEYLASMLGSGMNIAVLSRGYKRKTKGFVLANVHSTPDTIGDEPLQIYLKHGARVKVAVCENRRKGIKEIMRQFPETQLILLDDAFQHRYVKPKVNILLTDYSRPVYEDRLLPLGRLRESRHSVSRADMVVVTKCPDGLPPLKFRLISKYLELMPYQKLFFSSYVYEDLMPVFKYDRPYHASLTDLTARDTVLLVTGIANPRGFIKHFSKYPFKVRIKHFPDHHDFTRDDLEDIKKTYMNLKGERKIIITTEKDAVRMAYNPYFPLSLKPVTFYVPISVRMIETSEGNNFVEEIVSATGVNRS